MSEWFVYIVECADQTLYTGITTNLEKRIEEHNGRGNAPGAKYTRPRQPVKLVYSEQSPSRSTATRREMEIKRLTRQAKLKLFCSRSN